MVGDRVRRDLPSCSMYVSFLSEWDGMPLQGFEWGSMWLVFRSITLEAIGRMGRMVGKLEVTRPVMKSWLCPSYRWQWFGQGQILLILLSVTSDGVFFLGELLASLIKFWLSEGLRAYLQHSDSILHSLGHCLSTPFPLSNLPGLFPSTCHLNPTRTLIYWKIRTWNISLCSVFTDWMVS